MSKKIVSQQKRSRLISIETLESCLFVHFDIDKYNLVKKQEEGIGTEAEQIFIQNVRI